MKKPYLSIRTKALIFCVASFLLASFFLTVLAALLVNNWKQRLVKNSVTLAEEHGQNVARELSGIIEKDLVERVEDLKRNPEAHSSIQLLLKQNEHIMMAAFVDDRGTMVIEHYRGEATSGTVVISPGSRYAASLPPSDAHPELDVIVKNPSERVHELKLPVTSGEKVLGLLTVSVSENAILNRLTVTSRLITRSLVILIVALSIILLVSYVFLWRIFSHHLALVQERDRLDKLASIGTLASGLAHEIRNPLNAMNVNLDVIREEIEDPREDSPKKSAEILTNLRLEIDQLNQTLSNFMKFALPGKIEKIPLNLVNLLRETLEFFAAEFKKKNIDLELNLPEECPIKGDPTSLKQVLINLLLNAVQAMEKTAKKRLKIDLVPEGKSWLLTVTDTGPGLGKEDPEKCFEVFYTTKSGGSGFGLPIARQMANTNGGRLWAKNAGPDGGARFHLTLPA